MFFILFFCLPLVISTTLSSILLICSSVSFSLLLIPCSVFFISITVFFSFVWLFFIFYNLLLKTSNFPLCASILLLSSSITFTITTLNSFLGRLLTSTLLSSSSDVLSCSFVWNEFLCHLILLKLLFIILGIWYISYVSYIGIVAFFRRQLMHHSSTLPPHHPRHMF